jgi:hypothetical protein
MALDNSEPESIIGPPQASNFILQALPAMLLPYYARE